MYMRPTYMTVRYVLHVVICLLQTLFPFQPSLNVLRTIWY
jgi:hypothetical protein